MPQQVSDMPTVYNNYLAEMPILDERRAIVELKAVSEHLKTLLPASPTSPLIVPGASSVIQEVQKLIDENNHIRLLLAEYGLNYEILRNSVRDLGTQDVLVNHDEQVYLSPYTKRIAIGDDVARQDVYRKYLNHIPAKGCRLLSKTWISLLETSKQSRYPYNVAKKAEPPWWPSTGPNKIIYKEQSLLNKHELITLLIHIMGVIVNEGNQGQAGFLSVDVAKLEEITREVMVSCFADKKNPQDTEQCGFLTPLFRVLHMEECYRRGEFRPSATVCVDLIDPEEIICWFEKRKVAQLLVREAESREYKDDETGLLPWQISTWSDVVVVRGHKYHRLAVLIPESAIYYHDSRIYDEPETCIDDFDYWGEGLYSKEGEWYGIDKDEVRSLMVVGEDEVWDGSDGQKYRKSIGLRGLFVGLTREVVIIDNVRYIEHLVLR